MTSVAPRDAPEDLPALTGLRAVAAVWVLAFHALHFGLLDGVPALRPLEPLIGAGYLGVDLFFTLSGFILTHVYLGSLREPDRAS